MNEKELSEFDVMKAIARALHRLKDVDAVHRVLDYFVRRHGLVVSQGFAVTGVGLDAVTSPRPTKCREIPGIACLNDNDEVEFTLRDIRAKSANDAAVRLVHIAILVYSELKGETSVPAKIIARLLNDHRCYDGNTRAAIARCKGIIKDKDHRRSLDAPARDEAQRIVMEIQLGRGPDIWKPGERPAKAH